MFLPKMAFNMVDKTSIHASSAAENGLFPNLTLYEACRNEFSGTQLREILQAVAGHKVSRLVLNETKKSFLRSVASNYSFAVVDGKRRYSMRLDTGKGNFANRGILVGPNEPGFVFTYVSHSNSEARKALEYDSSGDSEGLGKMLSIPPCCRDFYRRYHPIARRMSQSDLVPHVWANSINSLSFDPLLNIVVRYMGKALISFFPCSFHCSAARTSAISGLKLMQDYDPTWAQSFLESQQVNVIYTENNGIHVLRSNACNGEICFQLKDLHSTTSSQFSTMLSAGNRIVATGPKSFSVYLDKAIISTIEENEGFLCLFRKCPTDDNSSI
jgi:hypothetical protein